MAGVDERRRAKLGYLGLGMMGFPMSRRLIQAGHDVMVWNRSAAKATALVEAGVLPAATISVLENNPFPNLAERGHLS